MGVWFHWHCCPASFWSSSCIMCVQQFWLHHWLEQLHRWHIQLAYFPNKCRLSNSGIGHIWHLRGIFIASTYFCCIIVNKCYTFSYECAVMWGPNVDFSRSAETKYLQCGMYTSTSGHTVDCIKFILGVYTDIVVSHLNKKSYWFVTFEGNVCCWHTYGNSIVNKSCNLLFFLLVYAVK